MEKVQAQVSAKYPDVPFDVVEKVIEKIAAVDPSMANAMKSNPDSMEIAYQAAIAGMKPQEKPDNLTDGEGGGDNSETIEDLVLSGKADDFTLGDYITSNKS